MSVVSDSGGEGECKFHEEMMKERGKIKRAEQAMTKAMRELVSRDHPTD